MRRMMRKLAAPAALAILASSMGIATVAAEEGRREAVVLRLSIDGEPFRVTAPIGESVRVTDRDGSVHILVPVRTPGPSDAEPRLALELYESLRINGSDQQNLLEVVPLPGIGQGSVLLLGSQRSLEVEAVEIRDLSNDSLPGTNLRPRNCCISCEGVEACGFCVEASCGVCCVH